MMWPLPIWRDASARIKIFIVWPLIKGYLKANAAFCVAKHRLPENRKTIMRNITHNPTAQRFEYTEHSETYYVSYRVEGGIWQLLHTEAPSSPYGRGIAADIVRTALEEARRQGVKIRSNCPFVIGYLAFHPEFADLEA